MKKYITIATLLAAGSAFADAEVLTLELPNSVRCEPTGWSGAVNNGSAVLDARVNESYGVYAGNAGGVVTWSGDESGEEGFWTQISNTTGFITLAGRSGAGGESFALVLGEEINAGTMIKSITFSYEISTPEANALNIDGQTFSFALGYARDGEYIGKNASNVVYSSSTSTGALTLNFSDAVSWKSGDKIVLAMGGPKYGSPSNTSLYNVGISNVLVAIPEPSTFGLLAGLGALALVASRRRRK